MTSTMNFIFSSFKQSITITLFVFVMMILVDYVNILSKGRMQTLLKVGVVGQCVLTSILGILPGCLGTFVGVSLYVHGLVGIGGLFSLMIATTGDEAYVMLSLFPVKAIILHGILFVVAVISGIILEKLERFFRLDSKVCCELTKFHEEFDDKILKLSGILQNFRGISLSRFLLLFLIFSALLLIGVGVIGESGWGWEKITLIVLLLTVIFIIISVPQHYLEEHLWNHIAKGHIWKVFLWTFAIFIIIHFLLDKWNLESFVKAHTLIVLIIAGLIGLIPESGPHLIFVMMYSGGTIPFSVLFTSSFVQDGHGMIPLLSYRVQDAIIIKILKLILGLGTGFIIYKIGF